MISEMHLLMLTGFLLAFQILLPKECFVIKISGIYNVDFTFILRYSFSAKANFEISLFL